MRLELECEGLDGTKPLAAEIGSLVIAGWAGRDREAVEHHIAELERLGVARPKRTPTYYRVAASRLTTAAGIEDAGGDASGEVEPVYLAVGGRLYVGVGSDHTDRKAEAYGVTVSKQMCDKPVAGRVWPFDEVRDHWDRLILRSCAVDAGRREPYQDGTVAGLLRPEDLISGYMQGAPLPDGTLMFGGTLPTIGGVRAAAAFEAELEDPVLGRTIRFAYRVERLPVEG